MNAKTKLVNLKYEDKLTRGEVEILTYDEGERLKRSAKAAGIILLATAGFAFVPILHFLLVPLGLLTTIIVGIFSYRQAAKVRGGLGTCPSCDKPFVIAESPPQFPLIDLCTECQQRVQIELIDELTP
ncbi:MAG: hypothetical protein COT74_00130 [Bdellovibrionales bacterium CG10_big_fil_rev_8_21_14_0_10_45_34]|nr:MAG: hypothetical protein COT74_00130 [Bdellovibrionales bacterium CG10_big_fil_rev_8_21_14_0_10_45_34]